MPLPMIVPTTMAAAWLTPRARTRSGRELGALWAIGCCMISAPARPRRITADKAGNISDGESYQGSDHNVPGPGNTGSQPHVEFDREAAGHADHRPALVRAAG